MLKILVLLSDAVLGLTAFYNWGDQREQFMAPERCLTGAEDAAVVARAILDVFAVPGF